MTGKLLLKLFQMSSNIIIDSVQYSAQTRGSIYRPMLTNSDVFNSYGIPLMALINNSQTRSFDDLLVKQAIGRHS